MRVCVYFLCKQTQNIQTDKLIFVIMQCIDCCTCFYSKLLHQGRALLEGRTFLLNFIKISFFQSPKPFCLQFNERLIIHFIVLKF